MKPKLVVGNWKMNKPFDDAQDLILDIQNNLKDRKLQTEVVLCPPFVYMELITDIAEEEDSQFYAGAQNCSEHESGAYTGEVSAEMLASMGVEFCIVGHSERRKYFGETHPEIPWDKIYDMRIVLAHMYVTVDCDIVYKTVKNDLPKLRTQLLQLKEELR